MHSDRMGTDVDLRTNDPCKQLLLANVRLAGGDEYLVADLQVRSCGFSCTHPFYFDRFHAESLMRLLEEMDRGAVVEAVLKQEFEDDGLRFRNDALGHVTVSGEVVLHWPPHQFAFTIETDQTVLRPFIEDFREALAMAR